MKISDFLELAGKFNLQILLMIFGVISIAYVAVTLLFNTIYMYNRPYICSFN